MKKGPRQNSGSKTFNRHNSALPISFRPIPGYSPGYAPRRQPPSRASQHRRRTHASYYQSMPVVPGGARSCRGGHQTRNAERGNRTFPIHPSRNPSIQSSAPQTTRQNNAKTPAIKPNQTTSSGGGRPLSLPDLTDLTV